jgi:hypothetical protein
MIIVLGISNLVGLHGFVFVIEVSAFKIIRGVFNCMTLVITILVLFFLLRRDLFLSHHSPLPSLLEWEVAENVLLIPLSAVD